MSQIWFSVLGTTKQTEPGKAAGHSETYIPAGASGSKRRHSTLEGGECYGQNKYEQKKREMGGGGGSVSTK